MQEYYARGGLAFSHRNIRFRAEIPSATPSERDNEHIVPLADERIFGVTTFELG